MNQWLPCWWLLYSRQNTQSTRLVSSGRLLKGIQTPLRKVSCFVYTWSVHLNSLLRTAGQLSPPSKNSSPAGHTHRKLPASPRGRFYPTIPQPEYWRGRGRVSDPTPQDTRVITSFQLSGRVDYTLTGSGERYFLLLHQKH